MIPDAFTHDHGMLVVTALCAAYVLFVDDWSLLVFVTIFLAGWTARGLSEPVAVPSDSRRDR